jgi:alpha-glucosidase
MILSLAVLIGAYLTTQCSAQNECPGYTAASVQQTSNGLTADLQLAGPACNVYGTDLPNLTLTVEYQTGKPL